VRGPGLIRCGKSCRLRWANYLRPDLKRGTFTDEEEDLIISLHKEMGNRYGTLLACRPPLCWRETHGASLLPFLQKEVTNRERGRRGDAEGERVSQ